MSTLIFKLELSDVGEINNTITIYYTFFNKPQSFTLSLKSNIDFVSTMTIFDNPYYRFNFAILRCLPAGSNRSLFSNNTRDFFLVSGLEAQLELEWKCVLLKENYHTNKQI